MEIDPKDFEISDEVKVWYRQHHLNEASVDMCDLIQDADKRNMSAELYSKVYTPEILAMLKRRRLQAFLKEVFEFVSYTVIAIGVLIVFAPAVGSS